MSKYLHIPDTDYKDGAEREQARIDWWLILQRSSPIPALEGLSLMHRDFERAAENNGISAAMIYAFEMGRITGIRQERQRRKAGQV